LSPRERFPGGSHVDRESLKLPRAAAAAAVTEEETFLDIQTMMMMMLSQLLERVKSALT